MTETSRTQSTLILGAGGVASLVALAMQKQRGGPAPALLCVHDGRPTTAARLEHARRQADFFGLSRLHELKLPHLFAHAAVDGTGTPRAALTTPQLLLAALQLAGRRGYDRLVWPATRGGDAAALAVALEHVTLTQHLAGAERDLDPKHVASVDATAAVTIETPLLELDATQVLDLGQRAGASWGLAWSCRAAGDAPCRVCAGCRQRQRTFDRAGIVDPLEPAVRKTPSRRSRAA